jgi:putative transposase
MVMPNHVHGIIVLAGDGGVGEYNVGAGLKPARTESSPTTAPWAGFNPAPTRRGLPEIIRGFKTFSARRINELRETPGVPVWQRNYYEHVVRGENELSRILEYIANNPLQWGWIGRTRFGPRIDQDKKPNRGRFDRSEIGGRV